MTWTSPNLRLTSPSARPPAAAAPPPRILSDLLQGPFPAGHAPDGAPQPASWCDLEKNHDEEGEQSEMTRSNRRYIVYRPKYHLTKREKRQNKGKRLRWTAMA
ncbi:hypothetical protein CI102_301 [Trichoderma harzianum]|nr:hypothetical protein CI102_301 [Trichoderma harzianum]